jgi:hypothetical protein
MQDSVTKVKIPIRLRIWRSKRNYMAVVTDRATIDALMPYAGRQVALELAGMVVNARLVLLKQKGSIQYLTIFLPMRMAPTWELLRKKADEHNAAIVVTETGDSP